MLKPPPADISSDTRCTELPAARRSTLFYEYLGDFPARALGPRASANFRAGHQTCTYASALGKLRLRHTQLALSLPQLFRGHFLLT
jgi:hypothetical protein